MKLLWFHLPVPDPLDSVKEADSFMVSFYEFFYEMDLWKTS